MSSIASARDGIQEQRKKSLSQERNIDRNGEFAHWKLTDVTQVSLIERGMALAVLPLMLIWFLLLVFMSAGLSFSLIIFNALSRVFR